MKRKRKKFYANSVSLEMELISNSFKQFERALFTWIDGSDSVISSLFCKSPVSLVLFSKNDLFVWKKCLCNQLLIKIFAGSLILISVDNFVSWFAPTSFLYFSLISTFKKLSFLMSIKQCCLFTLYLAFVLQVWFLFNF